MIHRVEGISPELHHRKPLVKAGDFNDKVGYLCVNQTLVRDSAVT